AGHAPAGRRTAAALAAGAALTGVAAASAARSAAAAGARPYPASTRRGPRRASRAAAAPVRPSGPTGERRSPRRAGRVDAAANAGPAGGQGLGFVEIRADDLITAGDEERDPKPAPRACQVASRRAPPGQNAPRSSRLPPLRFAAAPSATSRPDSSLVSTRMVPTVSATAPTANAAVLTFARVEPASAASSPSALH